MDLGDNWLIIAAGVAALIAVLAWLAENRRVRRVNLDQVGFMPWTGLFFFAILAAVVLLALGVKAMHSA
ncbi:hypothetical protein ABVV53_09450 [Novosphingobium sp. RD2P27]|uniref:Uncharacterized protein n=1 Tax=Novosphingobium kalidii TaxID=3230299 RepID=A0ABV2D1C6_9SPHN